MQRKVPGADRIAVQNAIKTLAANIRFSSVDKPIHTIAVVSSIPEEGKTTIAASLGRAFADSGASVILVECDMRRRSMASALGVHGQHGIYSVLSGHHSLQESAVQVTDGLYFLDAEPGIPNPAELLQSKRFHQLMHTLSQSYDYVLFDTPPILTFVDGAVIASQVDATVLVVRQDFTHRDEVGNSYDQLQKVRANVIGAVLNYTEADTANRYYNEYHQKKSASYDSVRSQVNEPPAQKAVVSEPAKVGQPVPPRRPAAPSRESTNQQQGQQVPAAAVATAPVQRHAAAPDGRRVFSPAGAHRTVSVSVSPDETSQFLANAGYKPRFSSSNYDEDE